MGKLTSIDKKRNVLLSGRNAATAVSRIPVLQLHRRSLKGFTACIAVIMHHSHLSKSPHLLDVFIFCFEPQHCLLALFAAAKATFVADDALTAGAGGLVAKFYTWDKVWMRMIIRRLSRNEVGRAYSMTGGKSPWLSIDGLAPESISPPLPPISIFGKAKKPCRTPRIMPIVAANYST